MARNGSGVENRSTSIRLAFTWQGKHHRETLTLNGKPILPSGPNLRYAHRLIFEIRARIQAGNFVLAEFFPDSPRATEQTAQPSGAPALPSPPTAKPRRPASHRRTALYRHFDADGSLLYVGVSLSLVQRLAGHAGHSHWSHNIASVTVEWLPSRADALRAERAAIQAERPKFNIAHNDR